MMPVSPDTFEALAEREACALHIEGKARAVAGMAFYTGGLDREAVALEFGT